MKALGLLVSYLLGICSLLVAQMLFLKPDDYYKNRCRGLEDELARLEELCLELNTECDKLSVALGRFEQKEIEEEIK